MFGLAGDDVVAALTIFSGGANESKIVGFGCTAGPDDLLGLGADELSDLAACRLNGGFDGGTERVRQAGGITKMLIEIRQHGLEHLRVEWGGGCVVEINGILHRMILMATKV